MFRHTITFSLLVLPALAAAAEPFELLPGVVVDRDQPAVYLMNPDQGIDAVDAATGALLWSSSEAAKPLLVSDDLLVAQAEPAGAGVLRLVALGRDDGNPRLTTDMTLPAGVTASIDDRLGARFSSWVVEQQGELQLGWENTQVRTSPLAPRPGEVSQQRQARGATVQLATKLVTPLAAAPARPAPAVARLAWDNGPIAVAGRSDAVLRVDNQRLILGRQEAKTGGVVVFDGAYHLRLPSVDGRHLLVSRETIPGASDSYTFEIFSLDTGKRLGEVTSRHSHAVFFVLGSTFIYESPTYARRNNGEMVVSPRKLRAVDLWRGVDLWERPLRDTTFRGSRPH